MRHRARLIGATLNLQSSCSGGTTAECLVPADASLPNEWKRSATILHRECAQRIGPPARAKTKN
jgi:hypothetical protein